MEEERESVQIALKRLSSKESYDRIYRIRRAVQCSYQHKLLPKSEWTKPEEVRYSPVSIQKDPSHLGTINFELLTIRLLYHRMSPTCNPSSSRSRLRLPRRTLLTPPPSLRSTKQREGYGLAGRKEKVWKRLYSRRWTYHVRPSLDKRGLSLDIVAFVYPFVEPHV